MLVPTSVSKSPGEEYSYLKAYKTEDLSLVHNLRYSDHSITDIMWHPKLNQIILGSTDHNAYVLYNPRLSRKGALLCVNASEKQRPYFETELYNDTYTPAYSTPYAMPIFKDPPGLRKQYARMRQDPKEGHKPEGPL